MIIHDHPRDRRQPTRRLCRDVRSPLLDLHRSRMRQELALFTAFALCMVLGVMIGLAIAADRKAAAAKRPAGTATPAVQFRGEWPELREPPQPARAWLL